MEKVIRTCLVILLSCAAFALESQVPFPDIESKVISTDHIERLKSGVLLVRLNSNRKKLEQINASIARTSNPKDSAKWADLREKTMIETAEEHYTIADAIDSEYSFSDVGFFMDYDTRAILDGSQNPLRADLKTEVAIDLSREIYILVYGNTPETSIQGYVILDSNLDNIPRPFPNNVTASGFSALFGNDYTHIRKLNKKLYKYYYKVTQSGG